VILRGPEYWGNGRAVGSTGSSHLYLWRLLTKGAGETLQGCYAEEMREVGVKDEKKSRGREAASGRDEGKCCQCVARSPELSQDWG